MPPVDTSSVKISIHALLAESDRKITITVDDGTIISIHALLAESDREPTALRTPHHKFLSTLSLRRATRSLRQLQSALRNFYPRSPCGERRVTIVNSSLPRNDFYPRSPCGERLPAVPFRILRMLFLSTLSLRRATHAYQLVLWVLRFLSTLSLRRATVKKAITFYPPIISIHALLAESDIIKLCFLFRLTNFYPRSPCGERPRVRGYSQF